MLKNYTLKNGTSRIGLYGSAPQGNKHSFNDSEDNLSQYFTEEMSRFCVTKS